MAPYIGRTKQIAAIPFFYENPLPTLMELELAESGAVGDQSAVEDESSDKDESKDSNSTN